MMEQGSLADLLTLAKSGDDNKLGEMMAMMNGGMGGQQWMWWILIILFAFGGFGNGMFGRNMAPNGLDNANQLILEKLNGMSVSPAFRLLLPDAAPYAGSCHWYSGTGYG